jgi:GMP synthase-like glutamine amidotransferase
MGEVGHPQFSLLSSHKDQVAELPKAAEVFATNGFCPIAGFTMSDQVITVQGHPEFSKPYAQGLLDHRRTLLGEAVYQQGMDSMSKATDELLVTRWLLEFVVGQESIRA